MITKKIDNTDIFIEDYERIGHGKVTISDSYMGAFTYTWGAMNSKTVDFLKSISSDYFARNLCKEMFVFDGKQSVTNIRKYIKDELKYELPFYKFQKLQKEMRLELKKLEKCTSEYEFVDMCIGLPNKITCPDVSYKEENEFKKIIDGVFTTEPWNFIGKKHSPEYLWLVQIFEKLKKIL